MKASTIRVLVVDDFEPWRRFISSMLSKRPQLLIVAEVSDGVAAIERAQELQPDLVLLDIGLPSLSGIEACRRIRQVSPQSKILFISEHRSIEIVRAAISSGGGGYVVKSCAGSDLLHAVTDVLDGKRFYSMNLGNDLSGEGNGNSHASRNNDEPYASKMREDRQHRVEFYRNDETFTDGFYSFARSALNSGDPVIVIATPLHGTAILRRFRDAGVEIDRAIQQRLFVEADVFEVLPEFMKDNMPVRDRVEATANRLLARTAKLKPGPSKIAICGELAPTLLGHGNVEGAMLLEEQFDSIARAHSVDVLCGYTLPTLTSARSSEIIDRLCAEHSSVKWCE